MNSQSVDNLEADVPAPPSAVRHRLDKLVWQRQERESQLNAAMGRLKALNEYLAIAERVTAALELLSQQLFKELLGVVEDKTSTALQEILEQPIRLRADAEFKRNAPSVEFSIDRQGHEEDVRKGTGGSVANILSVSLRLFALTTLDPARHRPFLVLDEQDCWLRPDLVPRLVKIVHEAGRALGFQVIMISHHDLAVFDQFADKVYRFDPRPGSAVEVREVAAPPGDVDPMR